MNNIPKYGPDAPFLDEEEKELVTDFEGCCRGWGYLTAECS